MEEDTFRKTISEITERYRAKARRNGPQVVARNRMVSAVLSKPDRSSRAPLSSGLLAELNRKNLATNAFETIGDGSVLWGHLGLLFADTASTKWYPVNEREASLIGRKLAAPNVPTWILAETLNNRFVAFRPSCVQLTWLLNDDCDAPEGNWDRESVFLDFDGRSTEFYEAVADWAADELWGSDNFAEKHSDAIRCEVLSMLKMKGLIDDPEKVSEALRQTTIHFAAGDVMSYVADPRNLSELVFKAEDAENNDYFEISCADGEFIRYYNSSMLRMIEFPKSELLQGVPSATDIAPCRF